MFVMMSTFKNQNPPTATQNSESPPGVPSNEVHNKQHHSMQAPLFSLTFCNPYLKFDLPQIPQYEEEISAEFDKETKGKVDELKK